MFAFFPFFISFFYFLLSIIPTNHCQLNESKIPRPFRYPYFPFFSLLSSSFSHRFPLLNACAFASRRPPLPPLPRPRIVITAAHILGENETQGKIGEQPASRLLESHPRRDEGRKKKNTLVEEEARRWNRGEEGGGRGSVEKKAARRTVVWTGDERLSSHMHAMAQRFASCLVLLCWKKKKKEKRLPDFFSPRMEQPSIIRKLLLVFYRVCVSRIIVTDFFVKSKNRDKLRNTAWWSIVHWKNAKNESTVGFLGR